MPPSDQPPQAPDAPDAPLMLSVSGCRGIMGHTMTPEVAARFGGVVGGWLRERSTKGGATGAAAARPEVVLARDGRAGGEILSLAAAAGLAGAGCNVTDLGVAMTPTVGVMTDARNGAAGMVITASHNPQEWNGIKVLARDERDGRVSACAPGKAMADEIIRRFNAASATGATSAAGGGGFVGYASIGTVRPPATAPSGTATSPLAADWGADRVHVDLVKEALGSLGATDDRRSMAIKAVVDSVNCSGRNGARLLLGARIIHHLGAGDNGLFPHAPEPTKENLGLLCRFVQERRADIGFAQDPDADRLAIVDERGLYIGEEYTLALAAEAVLGTNEATERRSDGGAGGGGGGRGKPVLVTNLSTSRMLEDVAARHGARVIRTAVGEANVVEAMKKEGALLGGEGNGGVIWPRVTYIRDSLSAMGLVLALMARTGKKVSELVAAMPAYAIVKRKVQLRAAPDAQRAVEAVARAFAKERVDRQDGVRVDFDARRAWLHVRASNTEPIMRLIAEAPTEAEAVAVLEEAALAIG